MGLPPACTWNNEFKTRIPRRVKIMILLNMNWRITFTHDLRAPGPYLCPSFCKGILRWATVIEMKLISPHGSEVGQHHSRISLCLLGTYSLWSLTSFLVKQFFFFFLQSFPFLMKKNLMKVILLRVILFERDSYREILHPTGSPSRCWSHWFTPSPPASRNGQLGLAEDRSLGALFRSPMSVAGT